MRKQGVFLSTSKNNPDINKGIESIKRHFQVSLHYLENGQIMLNKGEAGKASELLWGSVAQALEAVAESRNFKLANHRSLRWLAAELSRETNDKSINNIFYQAEALHSNFHTVELTVQEVATNVEAIRDLVSKLLSLIPSELASG